MRATENNSDHDRQRVCRSTFGRQANHLRLLRVYGFVRQLTERHEARARARVVNNVVVGPRKDILEEKYRSGRKVYWPEPPSNVSQGLSVEYDRVVQYHPHPSP